MNKLKKLFGLIMYYIIAFGTLPLFLKKVYGIENIPKQKKIIIAANHASHLDPMMIPVIIYLKYKRLVHYIAKKELFENWFIKYFFESIGIIRVDRQAGGKKAIQEAIETLNNENIIGIFPEGTRSLTNTLGKPKTGAARLAIWSKTNIVPCAVDNSKKIFPKGSRFPTFKKTNIYFGKPIDTSKYEDTKEGWQKLTEKIMHEITELLKKSEFGKDNYKL